jgi:hypothetical protein
MLEQPKWANAWLIEKFVRWLDGGPPMETRVEENLQAVAIVFAAIESSRSGRPVRVQELLAKSREQYALPATNPGLQETSPVCVSPARTVSSAMKSNRRRMVF